jgi:hypothetical protein
MLRVGRGRELETVREQIAEAEVHQDRLRVGSARAELAEARPDRGRAEGLGSAQGSVVGQMKRVIDGDTLAEVCCEHRHRFSFIARRL